MPVQPAPRAKQDELNLNELVAKIHAELNQRVPEARVRQVATDIAAQYEKAQVTSFVPIFVRRQTLEKLSRELQSTRVDFVWDR